VGPLLLDAYCQQSAVTFVVLLFYCVDGDLGKMFLNFPLDPEICPYAGVDLRTVPEGIKALNNPSDGP
jgi:hypothetical protein